MDEELKDLADTIDEVEDEILRQWAMTKDPKLEKWWMSKARVIDKMKNELTDYLRQTKERKTYAQF